MFDIGFSELLVIGLVALVVIGPERLPKVARAAGQWLGKLNRYVSQVKQDIDRDIKLEELRKMQQDMKDAAQKYEIMAGDAVRRTQEDVQEAAEDIQSMATDTTGKVAAAAGQESGQISRVMQAMSATDGGLAMQEYEKIKAEEAAAGNTELPGADAPAPLPVGAAPVAGTPSEPAAAAVEKDARPVPPQPKVARLPDDYPDGPVG
jgi:sec-independent protein translocase protein TatB